MFKKVDSKINFPELEKSILDYWKKNSIFEKSVNSKSKDKSFSFYDGPPFATGLPHYGHLLAGTIKDVVPRFKAMQGYRVERIWGWDTHGLPIENIVEQEMNLKTKNQVLKYGIEKFNEKCRTKVLKYAKEWEKIVERTGRWVDMDNAYLTMSLEFMESVWWAFKKLWDNGLIYKGHKIMPYCARCATGLSAFEVGMPGSYIEKNDKAITVKFELEKEPGTYVLAWTTTPWTLPGNLALAVGADITYVKVKRGDKFYILAKKRLDNYEAELGKEIVDTFKGSKLVGLSYKPIFPYYKNVQNAFLIVSGSHVTTEDGTGIVHTAPAFGEEDYEVAKNHKMDFFMPVDDLGNFTIDVPDYAGKSVVEFETNDQIIKDLGDKVLKVEDIYHSYPHCWRCHTPLIYKAVDSYFVAVQKIKSDAIKNNQKVRWVPEYVGRARFNNLLETAPDWNISRNRFWGTPLPVWVCRNCQKVHVVGSRQELEEKVAQKISDLHLHKLDKVKIPCQCGGLAKLSGEVLDCWFESGSMPYASIHYPFENQDKFKRDFPADFIAEGIDQTRGWFNSLLILSTALFGREAYKNVIVNGTVLAEDGQKMSKSLRNYPDPMVIIERYGADALRFYLMGSPVVRGEDFNFSEKGVGEVVKSVLLRLWNSYSFFVTYANLDKFKPKGKLISRNKLDRWLVSKVNNLIELVTQEMEKYELMNAARLLSGFIEDLSNWYIRRSRKRFWKSENDLDKECAYETLYFALVNYVKLLAPFAPFVTEEIYRNLTKEESVHLASWPKFDKKFIDEKIENQMQLIQKIVEMGLAQRNEEGIKVRQPLAKIEITLSRGVDLDEEMKKIIAEEINVKKVELKIKKFSSRTSGNYIKVSLDTRITQELRAEGLARDFIRFIQEARKKANFNVEDRIETYWLTDSKLIASAIEGQRDYIASETLSVVVANQKNRKIDFEQEAKLENATVWLGLKRITK